MEARHMENVCPMVLSSHCKVRIITKYCLIISSILLFEACATENHQQRGGRDHSNLLVTTYGKHIGAGMRTLGADDDLSFGDFGFHYNSSNGTLTARIFIMRAHLSDWGPKAAESNRKVAQALNDPRIGGMYERGGGHFILDEKKEMFFLVKDFSANIDLESFKYNMDELRNIGARWVLRWISHVADQALGHESPPKQLVTRQNDPYI